jgi:hypothetical protein
MTRRKEITISRTPGSLFDFAICLKKEKQKMKNYENLSLYSHNMQGERGCNYPIYRYVNKFSL